MENTYALDNQCKEMKNVSSSEDLKLLTSLNGQYGLFRLFQDFLYIDVLAAIFVELIIHNSE